MFFVCWKYIDVQNFASACLNGSYPKLLFLWVSVVFGFCANSTVCDNFIGLFRHFGEVVIWKNLFTVFLSSSVGPIVFGLNYEYFPLFSFVNNIWHHFSTVPKLRWWKPFDQFILNHKYWFMIVSISFRRVFLSVKFIRLRVFSPKNMKLRLELNCAFSKIICFLKQLLQPCRLAIPRSGLSCDLDRFLVLKHEYGALIVCRPHNFPCQVCKRFLHCGLPQMLKFWVWVPFWDRKRKRLVIGKDV